MSRPPHVTTEQRRRLLVRRQLLGASGRLDRTLAEVADAIGLLHSTDPATPYLSIHARCGASSADIDAAFYGERSLVRHTTIRRTVFAMPYATAVVAHGAVNPPLVERLRAQLLTWLDASDDVTDDAAEFLRRTESEVVDRLRGGPPIAGARMANEVPSLAVRVDPMPGASYSKSIRITSKVLEILAAEGRIARARPTGADFTSAAWTWTAFDTWFGRAMPADPDAAESLAGLLDRYLSAFGPATVTDMAWWAGVPKGRVRAAIGAIGALEVELEASAEVGFVRRRDDLDELAELADRSPGSMDPGVALLPGLDSTTMGWKQRSWYVDDRPAAGWFDRNGNAGPTIWADGRVVGVWTQRADGEVVTEVGEPVDPDVARAIDVEAERLSAWLGDVRVKWRYPTPITKRLVS